jgi:hypothetical protein
MKTYMLSLLVALLGIAASARCDIKVTAVKGNVYVRHNVQENWTRVAAGDILKPEDSMKLDRKASATILIDDAKKLVVPELVIVDLSDFRQLSQEDLLLRLAMEHVRSISPEPGGEEFQIPQTTTMHGENKDGRAVTAPSTAATATLQLNGTKVLYTKGYYATCALKTKEIFRLHPELRSDGGARIMVAGALENMKLYEEALNEYLAIPQSCLSAKQEALVNKKISQLKKSEN